MKRISVILALVVTMSVMLSGCYLYKPMYKQENADRIADKGKEIMLGWLGENMPDATLEECKAYISWTRYDGNEYLTDYATGRINHGDKSEVFTVNTVTGELYFEADEETKAELCKITEAHFNEALESIGIISESTKEGYAFQCYVMAPARGEGMTSVVPHVYSFDLGLPEGVTDIEAYVKNPDGRLAIYVDCPEITVSDDTDLSVYDLSALEALENEYGLHIGSVQIENSTQYLQKFWRRDEIGAELWEYGVALELDGAELRGRIRKRTEIRNRDTNELTASDITDPAPIFEKTDYGYRLTFNKELNEYLRLKAYEGAEILSSDYYRIDADDYSPTGDIAKDGIEAYWKETSDGVFVLTRKSDDSTLYIYNDDLLVRKK